jgi:hypothetical protein
MIDTTDHTQKNTRREREVATLKALARRGPKNRWQAMVLRALKKRYPRAADSLLEHHRIPPAPPQ